MAYRHFFTQRRDVTPEEWAKITEAFGKVVSAATDVRLNGLEVDHEVICFDGQDKYQVLRLCREGEGISRWVTGKTRDERQSYDVVVVALLTLAEYLAPGAWAIGSDGSPTDWVEGVSLARDATGIPVNSPV